MLVHGLRRLRPYGRNRTIKKSALAGGPDASPREARCRRALRPGCNYPRSPGRLTVGIIVGLFDKANIATFRSRGPQPPAAAARSLAMLVHGLRRLRPSANNCTVNFMAGASGTATSTAQLQAAAWDGSGLTKGEHGNKSYNFCRGARPAGNGVFTARLGCRAAPNLRRYPRRRRATDTAGPNTFPYK